MLIYDNEYETKENKNWTKDKIELQQISVNTKVIRANISMISPDIKKSMYGYKQNANRVHLFLCGSRDIVEC